MAEWKLLSVSDNNDEFYADFSTRKVNNRIVKIWIMTKFGQPSRGGDLVSKTLQEFDCRDDTVRDQYLVFYSDIEMSNTTSSFSAPNKNWIPIVPDSVYSKVLKRVCSK